MKTCDFYYKFNTPYCEVDGRKYKDEDAIDILCEVDKLKIDRIKAGKNTLKLFKENRVVRIYNIDKFAKDDLLEDCLHKNYPKIKKALEDARGKEKKPLNNALKTGKRVAYVGSIALMLMATNKIKQNNLTNENNNKLKVSSNIEKDNDTIIDKIEDMIHDDIKETNPTLDLKFDNLSDSEKALYVQKTYGDLITQYSNKWGVDDRLVTAILTQESGGKETNLMQIEYNAWKDQVIYAKNFNDNTNVKVVLTENPEKYDSSILTISKDELNNPKTNISIGTILLTYNLKCFDYNIPIALTSYNCGTRTMNKILDETCKNTGYTKEDLIKDPSNLEFLNYRYIMTDGDNKYFENVIRYVPDYENEIRVFDNNNEEHFLRVSFNEKTR